MTWVHSLSHCMGQVGGGKGQVLAWHALPPRGPGETDRAVRTVALSVTLHISRVSPGTKDIRLGQEAWPVRIENAQYCARVKLSKQEGWMLPREVNVGPLIADS